MSSPNEPLRAFIHTLLISIDSEQVVKQDKQFPVLAENIASLVRSLHGHDAEPKHVTIRTSNERNQNGGIVAQHAQVVVHETSGDKLLIDATTTPDRNLVLALEQEVEKATMDAIQGLRMKEQAEAMAMMEAIQREEF